MADVAQTAPKKKLNKEGASMMDQKGDIPGKQASQRYINITMESEEKFTSQ